MPINPNGILLDKLEALIEQLTENNRFLKEQSDRVKAVTKDPTNIRIAQDEAMGITQGTLFDERQKLSGKARRMERKGQVPMFGSEVGTGTTDTGDLTPIDRPAWSHDRIPRSRPTPPDSEERVAPQQGRFRKALGRVQAYAPGEANDPHRLPPGHTAEDALSVMPWLLMGEGAQGAPRMVRDVAMANWSLQRSVDWAAGATGGLSKQIKADPESFAGRVLNADPETGESGRLKAVQGALGWAQDNRGKVLAGTLAARGAYHTIGKISSGLSNMKDIGQLMGYESFGGGPGFLGFNNPAGSLPTNPAVQEGMSFETEKLRLMGRDPTHAGGGFGAGLRKDQATQVMDVLANQGWHENLTKGFDNVGQGNATTIAENYMRPIMQKYPGLSAQDLGQFTDQLRFAGASTTDLRNALEDMGKVAGNTQQTIGQATSSLKNFMESAPGANTYAGMQTGKSFSNITGMNAQYGAAAAQSPMVQAMALQQGVMPWAIGESGSILSSSTIQAVTRLSSMTQGLNQNTRDANGVMHSGLSNQAALIAQQTGLPQNAVLGILQNQKQLAAGAKTLDKLGDPSTMNTFYNEVNNAGGMKRFSHMTKVQNKAAQATWEKDIEPTLQAAGASKDQIQKWSHEGFRKRYYDVQGFVGKKSGDLMNTPDSNANSVTVKVQLSGAAAQMFKQPPVSQAKLTNGAGMSYNGYPTYGGLANSPSGDLTSKSLGFGGAQSNPGLTSDG